MFAETYRHKLAEQRAAQQDAPEASSKKQYGGMDGDFADRMFARLDRRARALAEIRKPKPKAFVPARELFRELVEELMQEKNIDRQAAFRIARKQRPELLEAMREDANPQPRRRR